MTIRERADHALDGMMHRPVGGYEKTEHIPERCWTCRLRDNLEVQLRAAFGDARDRCLGVLLELRAGCDAMDEQGRRELMERAIEWVKGIQP